ncbi:MAG: hypothetical protein KME60_07980 [Cyanomargarita calcarea GSE-NOS-MK-12-04C]|jgi:CRISPR-associated protein Csx3|uniref:Uncharacterized protein n=1 Tax=Cyanomargarita calcarea GSE-NOS-MK-12-04C TaxID=2839659 RepID=A0A951USK7_9CYAN|nr:hypothetical protein [Cyanomargarita calcarea GSE-NOS-MK-12-04C]
MTTYHISLEDDVLKVGFGATLATGDCIVRDTALLLDKMIASGELLGGELIKINGRASILVVHVISFDGLRGSDPRLLQEVGDLATPQN